MLSCFRGHPNAWGDGSRQGGTRDAISTPYDEEFKQRAVRLVTELGMTPAEAAKDLGCSPQANCDWRRQAEVDAGEREGLTSEERERLQAENAELRRKTRRLEERETLKAAAAYFGLFCCSRGSNDTLVT